MSVRGRARRRAAGPRGQGSHRVAAVASAEAWPARLDLTRGTRLRERSQPLVASESVSRIDRFEARENTFDRDIGSFRFEMRGSSQQK